MDRNASLVNGTIMIVDDELFYRKTLRDILEEEGFKVVAEAVHGKDAVEKYQLFRPLITVMDIFMPVENGFDALRKIMSIDGNARVLICSGADFDENVEAALNLGARGVILKPFIRGELIETIKKVMEGR
jgi:two-component system, chemotaxis family, chemotaxis protein CheY